MKVMQMAIVVTEAPIEAASLLEHEEAKIKKVLPKNMVNSLVICYMNLNWFNNEGVSTNADVTRTLEPHNNKLLIVKRHTDNIDKSETKEQHKLDIGDTLNRIRKGYRHQYSDATDEDIANAHEIIFNQLLEITK